MKQNALKKYDYFTVLSKMESLEILIHKWII